MNESIDWELDKYITTAEACFLLGYENRQSFNQPRTGFAARNNIKPIQITKRSSAWKMADVVTAGEAELEEGPGEERDRFMGRVGATLVRIKAERGRWRRSDLAHWEEAREMLGVTRERLYQLSDFRPGYRGRLRTIKFGRLRFWIRAQLEDLVDERS